MEGRNMPVDQNLGSSPESAPHVMERGDIFFAYRPKVEAQIARGFEDMARLPRSTPRTRHELERWNPNP
jgi:hypothetical protein